jgi:hypothetical protein
VARKLATELLVERTLFRDKLEQLKGWLERSRHARLIDAAPEPGAEPP